MGDRGYTIGILIGSILLLSAGIALTWVEIQEYRHGVERPHREFAAPAERPGPGPEMEE